MDGQWMAMTGQPWHIYKTPSEKLGKRHAKGAKVEESERKIPQEPMVEVVLWRNKHEKRVLGGVLVSL
jgi:translation elongation factor P/translation initiation factor 5A